MPPSDAAELGPASSSELDDARASSALGFLLLEFSLMSFSLRLRPPAIALVCRKQKPSRRVAEVPPACQAV